jgi:diketogulonate reductase-like aldo/keto reductase
MRAMEKLVDEGMTRFLGVSNFDVEELRGAEATLRNERLACDQVLYHLGDRGIERRLLPYCREREIAVVGYSPFGNRGFRGNRQTALNFLARAGVFLIPKSSNPDHVRENAAALDRQLSPAEIAAIDRAHPAPDRDVPLGMI